MLSLLSIKKGCLMSLTSFSNKKESRLVGEGEVTVSFFLIRNVPAVKHTQVARFKGG